MAKTAAGGGEVRSDLNRLGLFSEMGFTTIGDPYQKPNLNFNTSAHKGRQMLPGGSKSKSALQTGYFDKTFHRVMEGEGYNDPVKLRRQERVEKQKRNLGKQFLPSHTGKDSSGLGNHYGTFSGPVSAFSPVEQAKKPYVPPGKNFLNNPAKKGTGYGFPNITIGTSPGYSSEYYDSAKEQRVKANEKNEKLNKGPAFKLNLHPNDYFQGNPYKSEKVSASRKPSLSRSKGKASDSEIKPFKPSSPAKVAGGSKAGCFTAYPAHSEDVFTAKKWVFRETTKQNRRGLFKPPQGPKSTPTRSIVEHNIVKEWARLNEQNTMVTVSV